MQEIIIDIGGLWEEKLSVGIGSNFGSTINLSFVKVTISDHQTSRKTTVRSIASFVISL